MNSFSCSTQIKDSFYGVAFKCKESSTYFLEKAKDYGHRTWSAIPVEKRKGLPLRIATAAALLIPVTYLHMATKEYTLLQMGITNLGFALIGSLDYFILSKLQNNRTNEIQELIEKSNEKSEEKEGVALILSAAKSADHNFAFAENDSALLDIKYLAEKLIIENKVVLTPQEAAKAIEEVSKTRKQPIKVVYIRGHGLPTSIDLGKEQLTANDQAFVEALKKTDASAHIILKSYSTGQLRNEQCFAFADQLSFNLPGRTVTGVSAVAAACLIKDPRYPQGFTLINRIKSSWKMDSVLPVYSFCVKDNKRQVSVLAPILKDTTPELNTLKAQFRAPLIEDNKYATDGIENFYAYYPLPIVEPS